MTDHSQDMASTTGPGARQSIGKTCPYCQYPIKPGADVVRCRSCGIPHHAECWEHNGGCTTFGCDGTIPSLTVGLYADEARSIDIDMADISMSEAEDKRNSFIAYIILILLAVAAIAAPLLVSKSLH